MADFIEVHTNGNPKLVNLDWVEEIYPSQYGAQIYYAFSVPDETDQDFFKADETYEEIKRLISCQKMKGGRQNG